MSKLNLRLSVTDYKHKCFFELLVRATHTRGEPYKL